MDLWERTCKPDDPHRQPSMNAGCSEACFKPVTETLYHKTHDLNPDCWHKGSYRSHDQGCYTRVVYKPIGRP